MAYALEHSERVERGLRRIANEQIDGALIEIRDTSLPVGERIHQVRKRCKKVRGVLRLFRPALGDTYGRENAWFRDTARLLSDLRDAETVIDTYDELLEDGAAGNGTAGNGTAGNGTAGNGTAGNGTAGNGTAGGGTGGAAGVDKRHLSPVRRRLTYRKRTVWGETEEWAAVLEECEKRLKRAASRIDSWQLDDGGYKACAGGLEKTYKRARKALDASRGHDGRDAEENHEWRKRVKYHWYHLRLLERVWEELTGPRIEAAHRLSQLLGSEHDLAVLADLLRNGLSTGNLVEQAQVVVRLAEAKRRRLMAEAIPLGRLLFAEKPNPLVKRFGAYWDVWRS